MLAAAGQGGRRGISSCAAQSARAADQIELCAALAEAGDARCLPLLPPLMRSAQPEVRTRAVTRRRAARTGSSRDLDASGVLLDDPDPGRALSQWWRS